MAKKRNLLSEQITYGSEVFTKDPKTGYYLSSRPLVNGRRIRLHRYVWLCEKGDIPDGFHVHHKDGNKDNNLIGNLALIPGGKHLKYHADKEIREHYDERVARFKEHAHPAAAKWHGSKEGRRWHREQWELYMKPVIESRVVKNCVQCGEPYETSGVMRDSSMFCSKKCKARHRRDSGTDNEERTCAVCGEHFEINRYEGTVTCSRKCAAKLMITTRKERVYGKSSSG